MTSEAMDGLAAIDARIAWLRDHRTTSAWLSQALAGAARENPVVAANDAELLATLLRLRAASWVEAQLAREPCAA